MTDELADREPVAGHGGDSVLDESRRLLAAAETELAELGREIARLGLGTHAVCAVCGAPAEMDRLRASPDEARCSAHTSGS